MNSILTPSQILSGAGVPLPQREGVVAIAAARRVAYSLPLPSEPVGDACDFYANTLAAQANSALGELNESAVCDYDFALLACRLFWETRYKIVFEPESAEAMAAVTALVEGELSKASAPLPVAALESLHAFDAGSPFVGVRSALEAFWTNSQKGG